MRNFGLSYFHGKELAIGGISSVPLQVTIPLLLGEESFQARSFFLVPNIIPQVCFLLDGSYCSQKSGRQSTQGQFMDSLYEDLRC